MEINNIYGYTFSPTGGTYKITERILSGMDSDNIFNITSNIENREFNSNDIIVFSAPVFGGRIPQIALDRIKSLKSNNTIAIPVVVYGNREYDDALLELKNTLEDNNFKVIAGGAFISKHSIATTIAADRPNNEDMEIAMKFGSDILEKIKNSTDFTSIDLPGNFPYKEYNGVPAKPQTDDSCIECGICAESCPVSAIDFDNPRLTDIDKCITCMLCIDICPTNSRYLIPEMVQGTTEKIKPLCEIGRKPELFI